MSRNAEMRLVINAENELVRNLAALIVRDPRNQDAQDLMLGLYNAAILSNQRAMTPGNAKIFSRQFQRLMRRVLDSTLQTEELRREREAIVREREELRPKKKQFSHRSHLVGFHVTPFAPDFTNIRNLIRRIMEEEFHCQLFSADQKKYEGWINANVRAHIEEADFFIIDLTGLNWNVMVETGAINFGRRNQPVLYICRVDEPGGKVQLPSDFAGLIVHPYVQGASLEDWTSEITQALRTDTPLKSLIQANRREPYISSTLLHRWTGQTIADEKIRIALCDAFPTPSAWKTADLEAVRRIFGGGRLAALAEITRAAVIEESDKLYG